MARPISPAIESTRIFPPFSTRAASASGLSGMVLVTTTSWIAELVIFSTAGSDSTGCEQQAYTAIAPFSTRAAAVLTKVPAVSIKSSMIEASTAAHIADDVHDFGNVHFDAAFVDDRERGVHFLCEEAGALHTASVGRDHRQIRQIEFPEMIDQHGRTEQVIDRDVEEALNLRRVRVDRAVRDGRRPW